METHANSLRQKVIHRFTKTKTRIKYQLKPFVYGLDSDHLKYDSKNFWNLKSLKEKLAVLPPGKYILCISIVLKKGMET